MGQIKGTEKLIVEVSIAPLRIIKLLCSFKCLQYLLTFLVRTNFVL